MSMPARSTERPRWTLQQLHELRERSTGGTRYEVVEGELLVTPSPSGAHQNAVVRLWAALDAYLRVERVGHASVAPKDVEFFDEDAGVQPDVLVIPLEDFERYLGTEPLTRLVLAAEVLSPGSARGDRVVKRALFQRHEVSEYWIVDLEARVVERWRPGDERPEVLAERLEWRPASAATACTIDLPAYFAEVFGEMP